MKIVLIIVGKTKRNFLKEEINEYVDRVSHYSQFEIIEIPKLKISSKTSIVQTTIQEGKMILKKVTNNDYVILLDRIGKELSSLKFANYLQECMMRHNRRLIFVIGGAYGFSDDVYQRADFKLSLSRMTFSHQMARLFFVEQLYRAYTILNNEPYHH